MARAGKCPGARWACQTRDGIRMVLLPIIGASLPSWGDRRWVDRPVRRDPRRQPRSTRLDAARLERPDGRRLRAVRGGARGAERAATARPPRPGRDLLRPRGAVRLHARDRRDRAGPPAAFVPPSATSLRTCGRSSTRLCPRGAVVSRGDRRARGGRPGGLRAARDAPSLPDAAGGLEDADRHRTGRPRGLLPGDGRPDRRRRDAAGGDDGPVRDARRAPR